jgi:hypothetical protein
MPERDARDTAPRDEQATGPIPADRDQSAENHAKDDDAEPAVEPAPRRPKFGRYTPDQDRPSKQE